MNKYYAELSDPDDPPYVIFEHYGQGKTRPIAWCHSEEQSCFITDILNAVHNWRVTLGHIPEVED